MKKIPEEEFYVKCLELLDCFGVDYKGDFIKLTNGGTSCIMNPKSQFYELFGGFSINAVAQYVAKKMGKEAIYIADECEF
jgi:hypothetical protein